QQKDREGETISVFSLNYGLCVENNIIFDDKSDRKFRVERVFDFNRIISDWMSNSQELVCLSCSEQYDISKKEIFIDHKIACQKCQGVVALRSIIDNAQKAKIESNIKIPMKEYEILNALKNQGTLTATDLGDELDRPYQSINHSIGKNSKIKNYEFIVREVISNQPRFSLSKIGQEYLDN
ncbi:hypothetical protein, partial [Vibrio crassostreae]|uniref:hypothetical protein n=1 Tax=Vibrio crassostreae TaxID=246167 RepID=UPI001301D761